MIVSMAMVVLPVWRSPMINSRCPRPMGIIESIDFKPVCRGSFTGCLYITPGAFLSNGISNISPPIFPRPSSGSPSGLITRPNMSSLTKMEATLPVLLTMSFSLISSVGPSKTAPILSTSRFITIACIPFSNSSNSFDSAFLRPYIRATPSLICNTVPTSSN